MPDRVCLGFSFLDSRLKSHSLCMFVVVFYWVFFVENIIITDPEIKRMKLRQYCTNEHGGL